MQQMSKKEDFLVYFQARLGASLSGNLLAGKGINRAGERIIRVGEGNNNMDPITNFEIQKYYENETRFNGVF